MHVLRSVGAFLSVVAVVAGSSARADEKVEAEDLKTKYLSKESVSRVETGFDVTLQPGMRWFFGAHPAAFYGLPEDAPPLPAAFGGGFGFDLGIHYRYAAAGTIGVEFGAAGHGSEPGFQNATFGANTYKAVLRAGGPQAPFWIEGNLGLGYFNMETVGSVVRQRSVASTVVFGAKLGANFAPVSSLPGLSFGPFAGIEGWATTKACGNVGTTSEECATPDGVVNGAFQLGLSARFVVPLTLVPPPPKPPTQDFVMIISKIALSTSDGEIADVTDTPAYRDALPRIRRVALSAPDQCSNRTAANATGQAAQTDSVLQTNCGVEMGEIERALTKAGFIVNSWKTLAAMVNDQRMTPRDAAAKLGAQVLFQVNSLEEVKAAPDLNARWQNSYFASTAYGDVGHEITPEPNDLVKLTQLTDRPEFRSAAPVQGAMLDLNAILVETGQTIWFYRWKRLDTGSGGRERKVLASRWSNQVNWTYAVAQQRQGMAGPQTPYTPAQSGSYTAQGGPANATRARYHELMREVVTDFVTRFTQPAGK